MSRVFVVNNAAKLKMATKEPDARTACPGLDADWMGC